VVAYTMGEWKQIPELLRLTKPEIAVWLVTFSLTVFADLTVAVEAGMILAALMFIRSVAQTTTVSRVTEDYVRDGFAHILQGKDIPPYVAIYRIHGPFLFGATDKLAEIREAIDVQPQIVILRLRNTTALDATGLLALEDLALRLHDTRRTLIVCGAPSQPSSLMRQGRFADKIGRENICANVLEALARAKELHEGRVAAEVALDPR